MQSKSDAQLLREYGEQASEAAFAELVTRYTNLVYGTAMRHVGSPDVAADIAQQVFVALAGGARALSRRLAEEASLAGWLCRSARNISLKLRRDELRRHRRERQAMEDSTPTPDQATDWERLRNVLDEAMAELSEPDYDALAMRFLNDQDLRSVGRALGVSDDAAQKRISRALEKLRGYLSRRGISTSAAALSAVLSANAVQPAPAALAAALATAALAETTRTAVTNAAAVKAIAMTTTQKTLIAATLAAALGAGIYEVRQAAALRKQAHTFSAQRYVQVSMDVDIFETTQNQVPGAPAEAQGRTWTNHWTISTVCTAGTNGLWQLDGNFVESARQKWFFDGTNVCSSLQPTGAPSERVMAIYKQAPGLLGPRRPLAEEATNLTITIAASPGGHPLGDVGVNIPWLALCSGTFLKQPGRIIPLPVGHLGHAPDAYGYTDKTETFADELGLPRTVELFTSKQLYEASWRQFNTTLLNTNRPVGKSPWADGRRKFHYTVVTATNFSGWHLPLAFEFAEDLPGGVAGIPVEHSPILRSVHGTGRVTRVSASTGPEGVFDPRLHQVVVDRRFRHPTKEVNGITYVWTNAYVAPTNDPFLQTKFDARVRRAPLIPALRSGAAEDGKDDGP